MTGPAPNSMLALTIAFALGTIAIVILARLAERLDLIDHPGGRKEHPHPVPLVGGLAIFAALVGTAAFLGILATAGYFLLALSVVLAAGIWDDLVEVSPRVKVVIQIVAASIMVWGAGVQLYSVGDLVGFRAIGLWVFAAPMTIFAMVGVVNAINMMDGLDGLAGSISLVAFAWYAIVAADSGLDVQMQLALLFCGAIAAFLVFNLRLPWQSQARVFLGDAGSLMLGFALGWFAIDLTQGPGRSLSPIAALWVLLLPLADCVSLMVRRVLRRKSPFVADRHHIHHYLLARGFTHGQTTAILIGLSTIFGAVGYFGWRMRVPEPVLFWAFFIGYFLYHIWIKRAWRAIDDATAAAAVPVTRDKSLA